MSGKSGDNHNYFSFRLDDEKFPLRLDKDAEEKIASINSKVGVLREEAIAIYRDQAWKQGIASLELKDLHYKGKSFAKAEIREIWYKEATIYEKVCNKRTPKVKMRFLLAQAYLCKSRHSLFFKDTNDDSDTCGWVLGRPTEKPFNTIKILSGSAGTNYYCRICGKRIGERITARS